MTPRSFDTATCKEFLGDARVRVIESKARADAEHGQQAYAPPEKTAKGYIGQVSEDMEAIVYAAAFRKRTERMARMAEKAVV